MLVGIDFLTKGEIRMEKIKIMAMAIVLVLILSFTSNAFADNNFMQYQEIIETNNFTITILENGKEYTKILIVNNETSAQETLESFTSKDGERTFIAKTETDTFFVSSNDAGFDIMDENLNIINSYDTDGIIPMADWGPPSYFSGDRHTDVGTLSLVITIIAIISGAPTWFTDVISVAEIIYTNNIPNVWYSGVTRTKWEDALRYTWTITDYYSNSARTNFIDQVDYIDFH